MRFTCPSCNSSYRLTRDRLGAAGVAKIKCPSCKTLVRVRATDDGKLHASVYQASGAAKPQAVVPPAVPARSGRTTQPRGAGSSSASGAQPKVWHVAIDRKAEGPMTATALRRMLESGRINAASLVWRKGQDAWKKMEEVSALRSLLNAPPETNDSAPPVKMTLKTGAALLANENDSTVMQDVVNADQLARTGSPVDVDAPTEMQDVVVSANSGGGNKPSSQQPNARPPKKRGKRGRRGGAQSPVDSVEEAASARTRKPSQKMGRRGSGTRLPARPKAGPAAAAAPADAAMRAPVENSPVEKAPVEKASAAKKTAKPTAAPPADRPGSANAAQSLSFFETGEMLNQDFDLQMPDPAKHKPTKEEYQNLLQEFSVMFRLDKRSKRQKVMLTVVIASLLIGVVAFGVALYVQGEQRKSLLRDSKTILAVFALPYQNSADFDLTPDETVEEGSALRKKKTVSILASELLTRNKKRIVAARKRRRTKSGAVAGGGYIQKRHLTKEQIAAAEAAKKAALSAALGGGFGGKRERVLRPALGGAKNVEQKRLRKTCAAKLPALKRCAESLTEATGFAATLHISDMGRITTVTCKVGGKRDAKLTACATKAFSRVNFGSQRSASTFTCRVSK